MSAPDGFAQAQRVKLVVILSLLAAAALGSFWMLEVMRQGRGDVASEIPKDEPDYTVEKFNFVRMAANGEARYNVSGSKLTHFPGDDSYVILQPLLHNLADSQAPLTVRAERAVIDHATKRINLYTGVHADREASPQSKDFHLATEFLQLLPDDDIMKTDQAVDILQDRSHITGTGMLANNVTHEFSINANAHLLIKPQAVKQ